MVLVLTCEQVARAGLGEPAKREGAELLYRCPHPEGHKSGDSHPSLKINPKKNVWACFPCGAKGKAWGLAAFLASCEPGNKERVKTWLKDKGLLNGGRRKAKRDGRGPVVAEYVYTDADGGPVARKLRHEPGENGKKKSFAWQRFENGNWVDGLEGMKQPPSLYRQSEIRASAWALLVESEKDADYGAKAGLPTCSTGGSNSWRDELGEPLRGKQLVIVQHADDAGRKYAQQVAVSLHDKGVSLKVVELPGAKDLAEAIGKGMTREDLLSFFEKIPKWKPETGAEILDAVMRFVRRFVSFTEPQARTVTLWAAHTHAIEAAEFTPYLNISAPEKESGKTRLLDVCKVLVANPWKTENASPAALVRKVHVGLESGQPVTVLFDERDSQAGGDKERAEVVRGILNSGYERGGFYSRCVGEGTKMQVVDFNTFGAKALAGMGSISDTVASRSIPIRMKRARRGEVEKFRQRDTVIQGTVAELKPKLAAWSDSNLEALRQARPEIPKSLSDRQSDCCEPLIAIADLAGGDWPQAARKAIVTLCGKAQAEDDSPGVRLLQDVRRIFAERQVDEIASTELSETLAQIETSPWGEWSHGKPITATRLARLLKPFDIVPDRIGGKDSQARGYTLRQFKDAFSLYLPSSPPFQTVNPSTDRINTGENEDLNPSTESPVDTSENAVTPAKNAGGGRVDTFKPGVGGIEREPRILFADDREAI
jgi:hypothetical protein